MMLKPCPFCGSEITSLAWFTPCPGEKVRVIHCFECDAIMTAAFEIDDEEIERLWNRRPKDDASD